MLPSLQDSHYWLASTGPGYLGDYLITWLRVLGEIFHGTPTAGWQNIKTTVVLSEPAVPVSCPGFHTSRVICLALRLRLRLS